MTKKFKIFSSISAWLCLLAYGVTMTTTHACNSEIAKSYNLSNTQMGCMYMCLYLGFFFSSILTGQIADKKGKLLIISFGIFIMALGLVLFPLTHNFILGMVAFALMGIGGGANETNVTGYIGDIWEGKRRVQMMNWTQTAFAFGAFLGPVLTGFVLKYTNNFRLSFYLAFSVAICGFIMILFSKAFKQEIITGENKITPWKYILCDKYIILMMLCLMFYCGMESGFSEWASVYYNDILGVNSVVSAQSVGLFWIGLSFGAFVFGNISKFMTREKMVVFACLGIIVCFSLWMIKIPLMAFVCSFWIGFFLGPVFGTCLGMGSEKLKEHSGAVTSVLFGGAYIGGAFFPAAIGTFADIFSIDKSIMIIPYLACGIILCVVYATVRVKKG